MANNRFKNKKIAVLGFGLEGRDAVSYLLKRNADITVYDKKEKQKLNFTGIKHEKVKFVCGKDYLSGGLKGYDLIVRSPGVYRFLPEIVDAEKKGIQMTSPIKIFFDHCPAKIIGVTGTKGKGTTSTLIYKILKNSGFKVFLAGNIGTPVLQLLPKLDKKSWAVLELSSFQLIDLTKSPHIAVVLNITEDHLDWHKDKDEYVNSKIRIVKYQKENDFAVLNSDYPEWKNFESNTRAMVYWFSTKTQPPGCFVDKDGEIKVFWGDSEEDVGRVSKLLLRGKHNWENVCAAVCAARIAGASLKAVKETVFSFAGLEHRLEPAGEVRGVKFINDSFSTNPQTTIAAIASFDEPLTLILGGSDKGLNYDEMAREIAKRQNIVNVVLIGDIAKILKKSISKAEYKGQILEFGKRNIKDVVKKCFVLTPRGGVVLLSPGTASFDMFTDYKDRGSQFKKAVLLLKN